MLYILSTCFWLLVSIAVHIIVNKFRLMLGISRSKVLIVLGIGFVGCIVTAIWLVTHVPSPLALPLTSILLYFACVLSYAAITASPTLGDQSPTTQLLLFLNTGPKTERQIIFYFNKRNIIGKRINDLIDSGCVKKGKHRLSITPRGKQLAHPLFIYRKALGLTQGG